MEVFRKHDRIRRSEKPQPPITLTPYQASRSFLFEGFDQNKGQMEPFFALNGFVSESERTILRAFSKKVSHIFEPIQIQNGFTGIMGLAQDMDDKQAYRIFKRLSHDATCTLITPLHLQDPVLFSSLSKSAQVVIAEAEQDKIPYKRFFDQGGVIMYVRLKKPSSEYYQAIERNSQGMSVESKIAIAQSDNPPIEIHQAGHNFIHVSCISDAQHQEDDQILNIQLNDVLDRLIEPKYAGYILRKNLFAKEMRAVFVSIAGLLSTIAVLHMSLNDKTDAHTLNSLVKAITPVMQDLVTYYSQIKPFLAGKTPKEKWQKMKVYAGPAIVGIASHATGGIVAQQVGENAGAIPGSIVYGAVPFLHSVYTALATINEFRKEKHISWQAALQEISRYNPAVNALLASSFVTFLTSIGVLGVGGLFNNDTAIALIEGGEEHALTGLFAYLELTLGTSKQFDSWATREIEPHWDSIFQTKKDNNLIL